MSIPTRRDFLKALGAATGTILSGSSEDVLHDPSRCPDRTHR
jgi:hypothetical protein